MQRLTTAGRLLITLLILAALYFGVKYIGGVDLLKKLAPAQTENSAVEGSSSMPSPNSESTIPATENAATDAEPTTATSTGSAFTYTPPAPTAGKLKGVVELGASGFNSFIIRVDNQGNWKQEKAEFGNSLVLENMASDEDIRAGLKKYIASMLDFGVGPRDIHFVVSSGAAKADVTQKIVRNLKALNYVVNPVTPEEEGRLALRSVLPAEYENRAFVADIGSGNTKISWKEGSRVEAIETQGSKYYQNGVDDATVADEVKAKVKQVPAANRQVCFIIGGVPFELAKAVRKGKERYTVLDAPSAYKLENAKSKAGLNIYKAIADGTGTQQFVFDWDANFTIGFLLNLPK